MRIFMLIDLFQLSRDFLRIESLYEIELTRGEIFSFAK